MCEQVERRNASRAVWQAERCGKSSGGTQAERCGKPSGGVSVLFQCSRSNTACLSCFASVQPFQYNVSELFCISAPVPIQRVCAVLNVSIQPFQYSVSVLFQCSRFKTARTPLGASGSRHPHLSPMPTRQREACAVSIQPICQCRPLGSHAFW